MDLTTNYCGMYWSNGKFQASVCGTKPTLSNFDATCYEHDCDIARATSDTDLEAADIKFYSNNVGKGLYRTAAANSVYYFNKAMRFSPFSIYSTPGIAGLLIHEVNYLRRANDMLQATRKSAGAMRGSSSPGEVMAKPDIHHDSIVPLHQEETEYSPPVPGLTDPVYVYYPNKKKRKKSKYKYSSPI
jgi:hypothetical protein